MAVEPLDLSRLKVYPLSERKSLTRAQEILIPLTAPRRPCSESAARAIACCADAIRKAKANGRSVMLIYGAHLLRNGTALLLEQLLSKGWITHLATNGAGTIHDWEYAWFGASTESVEQNVATGTFGTWNETGQYIHLAVMAGALAGLGYGQSLGKFICEDGLDLPRPGALAQHIAAAPTCMLTAARADLFQAMHKLGLLGGRLSLEHRFKQASIIAQAWKHGVPVTVHPGIGYDIISNHPVFSGSALGRAAELDFKLFGGSVEGLDDGVVLSVGSAIMGPQVFEKSLSCVNNLRLQEGRKIVQGHKIFVVDLQDGGGWDWSQGEPPKANPAYYLRFCKSYSRMGGEMHYVQSDNAAFVLNLFQELSRP